MAIHNFYNTAAVAVLMLCFGTGTSDIVVAPSSREVQLGGSTYFNCSTSVTSKEIHWFHYPVSSTERSFVYGFGIFYSPYLGRFSMDKNATTGGYNLVITSVMAADAGKYECQDDAGSGAKKSAQLIFLDVGLVCLSNVNTKKVIGPNSCDIEPDQLILTCMVQYHGNEAPILHWGLNDTTVSITDGVTSQINDNRVTYNLTMTTDQLSDGSFYECRPTRSTSKISCKSGSINVVGSNEVSAKSDGNCESYKNAVICIVVLLLIPLSVGVVALPWMLIYNRRHKRADFSLEFLPCVKKYQPKENNEPTVKNNVEVSLKNEATEEEPETTDASNTKEGVTEDPEAADGQALLPSNPPEAKNASQETELRASLKQVEKLKSTIKRHDTQNAKVINSLQARVKYLEQHLYPKETVDYAAKPSLAHTIHLSGNNELKPITGITVLGNALYAVTEGSQEIGVYDSKTFQHELNMEIIGMTNPLDIASSKKADCLYVVDQVSDVTESEVMRLDRGGNVHDHWKSGGQTGRLSTYESNVVVCLFDKHLITEYSPKGVAIKEVRLSPAAKLNHPWHAIKVSSMHFVVSFGDDKNPLHRVCVVDLEGNITVSTKFDELKISPKMKVPVCLVEDNERYIIVADKDNNRILLLSPHLEYKKNLLEIDFQTKDYPVRLCFDETDSKLFVGVNRWSKKKKIDHCIMIFNADSDSIKPKH